MTGRITVSKTKALGEASMLIASAPQATVTDAGLSDDWTIAEIRRVDIPNKRMTLKHGEIKGLDMPPMTMVFYVDDTALLQGLKQGDTVRVRVRLDGKRYVVTQIEPQ
jgi:Cu/Ag efflux protein CusF